MTRGTLNCNHHGGKVFPGPRFCMGKDGHTQVPTVEGAFHTSRLPMNALQFLYLRCRQKAPREMGLFVSVGTEWNGVVL